LGRSEIEVLRRICRRPQGEMRIRGPFAKFVDWWQCATVMHRETVTVIAKL
jgi:hypothetical protein